MTDRLVVAGQVFVTAAGAVLELAEHHDVTEAMVRAWARRTHIRQHRLGGRVYYPLADLLRAEEATDRRRATHGGRPRPKILDEPLTSVVHLGAVVEVCPEAGA